MYRGSLPRRKKHVSCIQLSEDGSSCDLRPTSNRLPRPRIISKESASPIWFHRATPDKIPHKQRVPRFGLLFLAPCTDHLPLHPAIKLSQLVTLAALHSRNSLLSRNSSVSKPLQLIIMESPILSISTPRTSVSYDENPAVQFTTVEELQKAIKDISGDFLTVTSIIYLYSIYLFIKRLYTNN